MCTSVDRLYFYLPFRRMNAGKTTTGGNKIKPRQQMPLNRWHRRLLFPNLTRLVRTRPAVLSLVPMRFNSKGKWNSQYQRHGSRRAMPSLMSVRRVLSDSSSPVTTRMLNHHRHNSRWVRNLRHICLCNCHPRHCRYPHQKLAYSTIGCPVLFQPPGAQHPSPSLRPSLTRCLTYRRYRPLLSFLRY